MKPNIETLFEGTKAMKKKINLKTARIGNWIVGCNGKEHYITLYENLVNKDERRIMLGKCNCNAK